MVTLAAGLAFGVFPAMFASRRHLSHAMKTGSSQSGGRRRWAGNGLVVFEVAVSTVLLIGSGLMVKSFVSTLNAETGFALEELLSARPRLPSDQYGDEHQAKQFHDEVAERVRALPGVEAAGWVNLPPLQFREVDGDYPILIDGREDLGKEGNLEVGRRLASEGNIYGVEQLDPAVLAGVAVAVALASLLAAYLPARRAMAVDPNIALRQE